MVDYRESYLKKMDRIGSSRKDMVMKRKQSAFYHYFNEALNKDFCLINGKPSELIFQDHSQSNNKDLSDDKYVVAPNETIVDIGSYIDWRDTQWLVFTEEQKTIPTHQQLKIKIVNWKIKWLNEKKEIVSYGAYVQNQTLYTLGVASQGDLISIINGKMMLYVQDNEETRGIRIGKRVFVGANVYKIMFADTVSRSGLINFLMEEDTLTEDDNRELGIADYYNNQIEEPVDDGTVENPIHEISGEIKPRLGGTYTYNVGENTTVTEWIIESIDGSDPPVYALERNTKEVSIRVKDDYRYVGQVINIIAKINDGLVISLPVKTINRFG